MDKLMVICLFIGLPICCGEWNGPFWVQVLAALLMFVPFGIVYLRERRKMLYGKKAVAHRGLSQKKGA